MEPRALKTCKALYSQVEDLVNIVDDLKKQVSSKDKDIEKVNLFLCGSAVIHLACFMYMI